MNNQPGNRIAAIAAISGALLLFFGTYLHPMDADPNAPLAAFTEYAVDHHWVASHLMQLFGVALMVGALVLLSRCLAGGSADAAATWGMAAAVASLSIAAALQAVDGVALKSIGQHLGSGTGTGKSGSFPCRICCQTNRDRTCEYCRLALWSHRNNIWHSAVD